MATLYLVIDRDEPVFKPGVTQVARTIEQAADAVHAHDHTYWPTWVVVRINQQPTHDELVGLFNGQWPDLSAHAVLGLWRVTSRGALRSVELPKELGQSLQLRDLEKFLASRMQTVVNVRSELV